MLYLIASEVSTPNQSFNEHTIKGQLEHEKTLGLEFKKACVRKIESCMQSQYANQSGIQSELSALIESEQIIGSELYQCYYCDTLKALDPSKIISSTWADFLVETIKNHTSKMALYHVFDYFNYNHIEKNADFIKKHHDVLMKYMFDQIVKVEKSATGFSGGTSLKLLLQYLQESLNPTKYNQFTNTLVVKVQKKRLIYCVVTSNPYDLYGTYNIGCSSTATTFKKALLNYQYTACGDKNPFIEIYMNVNTETQKILEDYFPGIKEKTYNLYVHILSAMAVVHGVKMPFDLANDVLSYTEAFYTPPAEEAPQIAA